MGGCPGGTLPDGAQQTLVLGQQLENPGAPPATQLNGDITGGGAAGGDGGIADGDTPVGAGPTPSPITLVDLYAFTRYDEDVLMVLDATAPGHVADLMFDIVASPANGHLGPMTRLNGTSVAVVYSADGYVGRAQFSFRAADGNNRSNIATAVIDVLPEVRFEVSTTDGPPPLDVVLQAFSVPTGALPEAEYTWHVDNERFSGPMATHSRMTRMLNRGGLHTVALSITFASVGLSLNCRSTQPNNPETVRIAVWPTVSGRVLDTSGNGIYGASVIATGTTQRTWSDDQGRYALIVPFGYSGSIVPSRVGYTFTPVERAFSGITDDRGDVNFAAGTGPPPPPGNDPPTAGNQSVLTNEDMPIDIALIGQDPDGDTIDFIIASLPAEGTLRDTPANRDIHLADLPYTLSGHGRNVRFTPAADRSTGVSFSFRTSDGQLNSALADVIIGIVPVNDAPRITQSGPLNMTVEQNSDGNAGANRLTLSATDVDAVGASLTWSISTQGTLGIASVLSGSPSTSGGSVVVRYVPTAGAAGGDMFRVRVRDSGNAAAELAVNVTIAAVTPPGTYYVDNNNPLASDNNPGTAVLPFRTIQRAANTVNAGDRVYVRAGVYRETLTISRNGTAANRIIFSRYQNDEVVIDGERVRVNCISIGRNLAPGGGHYVTVDGFVCKNPGFGSGDGGIALRGCTHVEVRNCRVFTDPWNGDALVPGIEINGATEDILIQDNHVYNLQVGIEMRWSPSGDYPGTPKRITIRGNHVHHMHTLDAVQQNNTYGITVSNMVEDVLIERNLVHHVDDFCIGTNETGGPTTIQYNIVYMAQWLGGGGGGNGIKIKPLLGNGRGSPFNDIVRYNVCFLNKVGIHLIQFNDGRGHRCYHNVSVKNIFDGIGYGTLGGADDYVTFVKNNIFAYNPNRDLPPNNTSPAGAVDYNYVMDGWGVSPTLHPHTLTSANSGPPRFTDIDLLVANPSSDGTPALWLPLNDPALFPDAPSALAYANNLLRQTVALQATSPCIDAGTNLNLGLTDWFGHSAVDNPTRNDPWPADGQPGLYDLGPIEYAP